MAQTLLSHLNPQQKQAVMLPEVSSLILAGAGSGKTSVLVSRIAYILEHKLGAPSEILAVTFTNKAAKEMLTRLQTKISLNPRAMWVGTFHGLCNRFLRLHHQAAGLESSFPILDNSDQLALIKRVMKENKITEEDVPVRKVQNFINRNKENGVRASDIKPEGFQERNLLDVYRLYEKALKAQGAVDFPELILRAYEVLMNNENIRKNYMKRFRFILVDEFQDTNLLQYKLIKAFAGAYDTTTPNAVFAVGDDDQSIYSFRGAQVENMSRFLRDFKIKEPIRLEQNYRSQGNILEAANQLISRNKGRLGKNLWTDAGKGELIKGYESENEEEEAAFVANTINEIIESGEDRREVAVLYRSNAQSRALETELNKRGIRYLVYGGLRFYERAEIKNSLAYLRLAENPHDNPAFERVVNIPLRGIGGKTMDSLRSVARQEGISLYEAANRATGAIAKKVKPFLDIINDINTKSTEVHLPDLVEYVNNRSGLMEMYEKDPNDLDRVENLNELISSARAFLRQEDIPNDITVDNFDNLSPLSQFLSQATLEAGENQAKVGEDAIQLMTVHASKGLEFDNVFVTGLEDGLFPHMNSMHEKKGLEEERRLMYVAVTRARKRLYLTFADSRFLNGQTLYNTRSQYLDDIPENCIEWLKVISRRRQVVDEDQDQEYGGLDNWAMNREWSTKRGYGVHSYNGSERPSPKPKQDNDYGVVHSPSWAKNILGGRSEKLFDNKIRAKVSKNEKFPIGTRVVHQKYGTGTVISYSGEGEDKKIKISFDSDKGKIKEFALVYVESKLTANRSS